MTAILNCVLRGRQQRRVMAFTTDCGSIMLIIALFRTVAVIAGFCPATATTHEFLEVAEANMTTTGYFPGDH